VASEKTVFSQVNYQVSGVVAQISQGLIGLPDLQRPFVWQAAKVRNLFDSMYRGYPIGHLLLWESGASPGAKQIGTDTKDSTPTHLIVDGQQRLTSLYSVMKRVPVLGSDGTEKRIRIAFRPRDGHFQVADAATNRDPAFFKDISDIWADEGSYTIISNFIAQLKESEDLAPESEQHVAGALQRLANLSGYPLTAIVLGSEVPTDQVAEVFVRINSEGKKLNQADFILTLMSVHWDEGRHTLENWCLAQRSAAAGGLNGFMEPDPDQMLRVSIALGFRRARLEDAYTVLRGRNPETGKFEDGFRDQQFATLADAQTRALDASSWADFRQVLVRAGQRSAKTISSETAVYYTYSLFLIGKHDYGVPVKQLREVIARWYFMASLTSRYTGSAETQFDADLSSLPSALTPDAFITHLDAIASQRLTNDYWSITLPGELATSASRSPSLFSFLAAQTILGAPVLFSSMTCGELLQSPDGKTHRHHLFPRKYLESIGVVDLKQINQIANMALLEARDNIKISADSPATYFPLYVEAMADPPLGMPAMSAEQIADMIRLQALWDGWEHDEYDVFLEKRRAAIAAIIRQGYEVLLHGEQPVKEDAEWPPSSAFIESLLSHGESETVELKSSLRASKNAAIPFAVLEKVIARTVAGFLNADGGYLIIGVADDGEVLGLDDDLATFSSASLDQWQQHLTNIVHKYLGAQVAAATSIAVMSFGPEKREIAVVRCARSTQPVFLKDGNDQEFHVRAGNSTRLLDLVDVIPYIQGHWATPVVLA
jgi:hypothetical protein